MNVDFRLVVATNQDLYALAERQEFRTDLYYRLNVIPVILPPLRERREDILPLAQAFLKQYCTRFGKKMNLTPATFNAIRNYNWPGNVRELKNFMERAVILNIGEYLDIKEVNPQLMPGTNMDPLFIEDSKTAGVSNAADDFEEMLENHVSLQEYVDRCERAYLEYAFSKDSSTYKVAEMLGTSQTSVMRKKTKYGF